MSFSKIQRSFLSVNPTVWMESYDDLRELYMESLDNGNLQLKCIQDGCLWRGYYWTMRVHLERECCKSLLMV